jgi:hypothetical protein
MYFNPAKTEEELGSSAWSSGARLQSAFQIGVLTEAFAQAWRTTGRPEIKAKMVAMADYIARYGIDSTYGYTGSNFGIVNGRIWHNYFSKGTPSFADPVYTISLVNTLVWGYIHTGERRYYDRARHFFNRGTKGIYGSFTVRTAPDTVAHHFVDTRFDPATSSIYLSYNKGELQYAYMLFDPGVVASVERRDRFSDALNMEMSPNPVRTGARIVLSSPARVSVFDISGALISRTAGPVERMSFSAPASLPEGVYIVRARAGGRQTSKRIVIQR